ncbi:MAG TPA: hypothetical protein VFQ61_04085 [Polyangiaceae bacterium]|nr:hypothetical protein [Polyangiaceae bacterium]
MLTNLRSRAGVAAISFAAVQSSACQADTRDWAISISSEYPDGTPVGVGLTTSVSVRIDRFPKLNWDSPEQLEVIADDDSVTVEDVGFVRTADGSYENYEVHLTPKTEGSKRLRFIAENIDDVGELRFSARSVGGVRYDWDRLLDLKGRGGVGFVDSEVNLNIGFTDRGGAPVNGFAGVDLEQPDGAGSSVSQNLYNKRYSVTLGPQPHALTVRSRVRPEPFQIDVVDASVIAGLRWDGVIDDYSLDGSEGVTARPTLLAPDRPAVVPVGYGFYIEVRPFDAFGRIIAGDPPLDPFQLTIEGHAVTTFPEVRMPVRLAAREVGQVVLHFSWGRDTLDVPIQVVPRGRR